MQCEWCGAEIEVGRYIKYDDMPFCDRDCLGEYLVDRVEDEIDEYWKEAPDNIEALIAEEREEIRRDLGGYYED